MTNRYEILDILSQDGSGVCFHARDRETGHDVALRRFFPFGPDGGGLESEERIAYEIGVRRLQNITHPALRTVLDGGTDPIDGMPFLVTEWIEGDMLSLRIKDGPLSSESVRTLADLALETSQILSEAFGEEAIWVETDPSTIIISDENPTRSITFWICPIRWLGDPDARSDLKPLLEMVENLSGWHGRVISRSSGAGLGAWVKTLRDEPNVWNLAQAKAALHEPATIVEASAVQASATPASGPRQQLVIVNRPVLWPWILASLLAFTAAGIVAWQRFSPAPATAIVAESAATPLDKAQVAQKKSIAPQTEATPPAPEPPDIAKSPASQPKSGGSAAPVTESLVEKMNRQAAELAAQAEGNALITLGEVASIEGTITKIETSGSGKSHYLQVTTAKGDQSLWAMFRSSDWEDFDLSTLSKLKGKQARLTGRWTSENSQRKFVLRMTATRQMELVD